MTWEWQTPAWQTPITRANRVELFLLPDQRIVPDENWPDQFWSHVSERYILAGDETQHVVHLFGSLERGQSARCHMHPWGLAFYEQDNLLFIATICYKCSNAYVYLESGKSLRAFDSSGSNAVELRQVLGQHLQLLE